MTFKTLYINMYAESEKTMNKNKIETIIEQLESALELARGLLQNDDKYIGKWVHKAGMANKDAKYIEFDGKNIYIVYKNKEKEKIVYWNGEAVKIFVEKGFWIPYVEERKFKHTDGFFIARNGKNARYVVFRDGKSYSVLKNGYRLEEDWGGIERAEGFVKEGYWIEVK